MGQSPLYMACLSGSLELMKILINFGANIKDESLIATVKYLSRKENSKRLF